MSQNLPIEPELSPERLEAVKQSLGLVTDVYRNFRDELMASYGQIESTRKSDNSFLTELDGKVEEVVKARLAEAFPQYGFQGEETGKSGNEREFWLVDPIDGTTSFIRGLPNCTNMGALIIDKQPVAAVIYNFAEDQMYTAIAGEGAFKNGERIHVSDRPVDESFVDNLSSHKYDEVRQLVSPYGVRVLQPLGAVGRSLSLLAEGRLDGVLDIGSFTAPHDRAPGVLLVKESGGKIVPVDGHWDIYTQDFVASTPQVADLVELKRDELRAIADRSAV